MNCMLVLVFYTSIQAFTLITTNVSKWERSGRLFLVSMLGLTTSMDGFWVIFTLARCGRTNSFAAYVLAFTGKSNIKCLNVPYKFLHWRFSSLLNSENCLHLTMQGNASTISKASGSCAMKLAATIWGMRPLSWTQVRLRNHNTQGRDSEVHQHIQALSRIWTKYGKHQFGKHPSYLPPCYAESVCTAKSENMSWLALMLQSTKCRDVNILQSILKVPNRFGGSQQRSVQCYIK